MIATTSKMINSTATPTLGWTMNLTSLTWTLLLVGEPMQLWPDETEQREEGVVEEERLSELELLGSSKATIWKMTMLGISEQVSRGGQGEIMMREEILMMQLALMMMCVWTFIDLY